MNRKEAARLARELVSKMTLDEKASQLRYDAPAIPRLNIPAYNWWNEALHGVARAGTATVFPQAIGLAAIFDEEFHGKVARCIGTEGRAKYNGESREGDRDIYKGLTFWSPNINIFRDPRWGRGHETYGEDPYLTSRLGVSFIKGLQGDGEYLLAAACAKHFAVHSGPESIRHSFDARPTKKDMEETYLPAFEAAVREAHVEAVMGAYNRVNGEPACGSKTLLTDLLREKWGFEGHVTSDCWAIKDFHTGHMVTSTAPESAAMALKAGCDLNCGNTYLHILAALQEGRITEEDITTACERLYTTRFMLGLFDENCPWNDIACTECDTDEHNDLALQAARKCMTLLKNDGILPLDAGKIRTLLVVGPNADSVNALIGNYHGTSSRHVTFLQGLRAYCEKAGIRVLFSEGCQLSGGKAESLSQLQDDRRGEALMYARAADAIVAVVGLDETLEGEEGDASNADASGDKKTLDLPASQNALLDALQATGKPMVTVLAAGSSINVPQGNALLLAWYPGQAGGTALSEILFGEVSPSGKLPVTFYRSVEDLPAFTDYSMAGRTYRYFTGEALYPFGFGLSYVPFALSDLTATKDEVSVSVRNCGSMAAENVIEVYVKNEDSPYAEPNPHLAAFRRISLAAGEEKRFTLSLSPRAFTVVDDMGERKTGSGRITVTAGFSQDDPRSSELMGMSPLKTEIFID